MSHEVTIGQAEVDLDYGEILENIEDTIASRVSDQINDEAWDAVSYQVEEAAEEGARAYCDDLEIPDVGEMVESLLREMVSALKADGPLCGFGTLAKEAIQLVAQPLVAEPFPVVDRERIDGDLDTQRRIADLERQVKALLDAVCTLGERAASVTPNG